MKTRLLSILVFVLTAGLSAQDCGNLFISEYVEGWSNNKALEVYNASPNPIDMAPYGLVRFRNQNQNPSNAVDLQGILMPYETYVVVIDKRDSTGVDFEAPVWDELQLLADTFANPQHNGGMETMYFNGNDAIMLLDLDMSNGLVVHDLIGKVGDSDFPDGWGPYIDSQGETVYMSANHTLIRKQTILSGLTSNPATYDLQAEFDTLPANTFDNLGIHICDCDPSIVGIEEIYDNSIINVFPNPSVEGYFEVSSEDFISEVIVYSITGEKIYESYLNETSSVVKVDTQGWIEGAYLVNIRTENNIVSTKRIIVR